MLHNIFDSILILILVVYIYNLYKTRNIHRFKNDNNNPLNDNNNMLNDNNTILKLEN